MRYPVPQRFVRWAKDVQDEKQKWLVEGLIPLNSITIVSGHQKRAQKSFTCDALALSLSSGIGGVVGKNGGNSIGASNGGSKGRHKVLLVQEEGSQTQSKTRMLALSRGLGLEGKIPSGLHYLHRGFVRLYSPGWIKHLSGYLKTNGIKVLFLDNLTYLHDLDENCKQDMSRVIDGIRRLHSLVDGLTLILVVHLNDAHGEDPKSDIDRQIRGSSVIAQAYDAHVALRRYRMKDRLVQGIVRTRLTEEKSFTVRWAFENDPEGNLLRCRPSISWGVEDKLIGVLEPGVKYTRKQLGDLWGLDLSEVDYLAQVSVDSDLLVRVGQRWKLV